MKDAAKNMNHSTDAEWSTGQAEEFRELALRYKEIGAKEGIKIVPYLSADMPHFQKATAEQRTKAISYLKTIVDIHEETIAAGDHPSNSKKLIWRALSKLSLVPGPDIFDNFTEEDSVIIYSDTQTIVFWNLQFFRYISFTVEQMFFCPWHEFTKRSDEIHQKLYEMAVSVITGKITDSFCPNVPGHEVQEVNTAECIRTWMEIPFASVLTKKSAFGGILVVQRMRIL